MAEAGKKARVVVVGGGIGGSLLAKTMQPYADVVLIDPCICGGRCYRPAASLVSHKRKSLKI